MTTARAFSHGMLPGSTRRAFKSFAAELDGRRRISWARRAFSRRAGHTRPPALGGAKRINTLFTLRRFRADDGDDACFTFTSGSAPWDIGHADSDVSQRGLQRRRARATSSDARSHQLPSGRFSAQRAAAAGWTHCFFIAFTRRRRRTPRRRVTGWSRLPAARIIGRHAIEHRQSITREAMPAAAARHTSRYRVRCLNIEAPLHDFRRQLRYGDFRDIRGRSARAISMAYIHIFAGDDRRARLRPPFSSRITAHITQPLSVVLLGWPMLLGDDAQPSALPFSK